MRILLDEGVPIQVRGALPGHEVRTVQEQGWSGVSNGDLLRLAEQAGFQLFVVADKNLRYQQNLSGRQIALLEIWTNHRPTLERHFPRIGSLAGQAAPGAYLILAPA